MIIARWALAAAVCVLARAPAVRADLCMYTAEDGSVKQVRSRDAVPEAQRAAAKCFEEKAGREPEPRRPAGAPVLPRNPQSASASGPAPVRAAPQRSERDPTAPDQVDLKGTVRTEDMASSIGRVQLRWPRQVETLFGKTPQRAVADAARTVSHVLKTASFPTRLQSLDVDWNIVFMDEGAARQQTPNSLVSNCHPAWMTPPANLYVAAPRVAAGCGGGHAAGTAVSDAELAHILIHEMGHAVEFALLPNGAPDHMRAEGFASWFESYASDFSSIVPHGSVRARYHQWARDSFKKDRQGGKFGGGPEDYGRAEALFEAISAKRGIAGLMSVYRTMSERGMGFAEAVRTVTGWDRDKWNDEAIKLVEK